MSQSYSPPNPDAERRTYYPPNARDRPAHAASSVTPQVYAHVIRDQISAAADTFARSIPAGDEADC